MNDAYLVSNNPESGKDETLEPPAGTGGHYVLFKGEMNHLTMCTIESTEAR